MEVRKRWWLGGRISIPSSRVWPKDFSRVVPATITPGLEVEDDLLRGASKEPRIRFKHKRRKELRTWVPPEGTGSLSNTRMCLIPKLGCLRVVTLGF